jgi:hypothetical protein
VAKLPYIGTVLKPPICGPPTGAVVTGAPSKLIPPMGAGGIGCTGPRFSWLIPVFKPVFIAPVFMETGPGPPIRLKELVFRAGCIWMDMVFIVGGAGLGLRSIMSKRLAPEGGWTPGWTAGWAGCFLKLE